MLNFYFNKQNTEYINFSIAKRYKPTIPKKQYKEYNINGINGKIYEDLGIYENIEIAIDCNFAIKKNKYDWENEFNKQIDWINSWLNDIQDNKLKFTDMADYFYKVDKVEITSIERPIKNLCKFTIIFTCKPFKYIASGVNYRDLSGNMRNSNLTSKPIYEITGNGLCEITCNGKKVSINVNGMAYINTELGLCYDENNNYINSKMTGYYEDLYYINGINNYSWTKGFTIKLKTNAIRL